MSDQGTRVIIFNLWEDDQGQLELDFGAEKDVSRLVSSSIIAWVRVIGKNLIFFFSKQ